MREFINIECNSCDGTGLYCGCAEPGGTAVVCSVCDGSGCVRFSYIPFTKRHGKRGIETVRRSRGTFIGTGVGPCGGSITYRDFQQGKMP